MSPYRQNQILSDFAGVYKKKIGFYVDIEGRHGTASFVHQKSPRFLQKKRYRFPPLSIFS